MRRAAALIGAVVPLPEKGFLYCGDLELTPHVGLCVVHEAGDGSHRTSGLQHAAIAVVNSWKITQHLHSAGKKLNCFRFEADLRRLPPDLYLVKRQNIRNSLAE